MKRASRHMTYLDIPVLVDLSVCLLARHCASRRCAGVKVFLPVCTAYSRLLFCVLLELINVVFHRDDEVASSTLIFGSLSLL